MADSLQSPWPTVSVIVPVRDGAEQITPCLDAVLAQDYPGPTPEVIVVDNGSTDGTPAVLGALSPLVRTIREPRPGVSWARNRAIVAARGEWLAFTDADCVPRPNWLRELVAIALADPGVSFVGGRITALPPTNSISLFAESLFDQRRSILEEQPASFISANLLARRDDLIRFGMFNPAYPRGQDTELAWRSQSVHGARCTYADEAIVEHLNPATLLELVSKAIQHGGGSARLWRDFEAYHGRSIRRRVSQVKPFLDAFRETVALVPLPWRSVDEARGGHRRYDPFYFAIFRLVRHLSFVHRTLLPEADR